MKKKVTAISTAVGMVATTALADNLVSYQQGKVSDSRYLLASADEMTCGKEMKEKVKECRKMMQDMRCGKEMMEEMKECKQIMQKYKEMNCGNMMNNNSKENNTKKKAKEMACGQCGAMK